MRWLVALGVLGVVGGFEITCYTGVHVIHSKNSDNTEQKDAEVLAQHEKLVGKGLRGSLPLRGNLAEYTKVQGGDPVPDVRDSLSPGRSYDFKDDAYKVYDDAANVNSASAGLNKTQVFKGRDTCYLDYYRLNLVNHLWVDVLVFGARALPSGACPSDAAQSSRAASKAHSETRESVIVRSGALKLVGKRTPTTTTTTTTTTAPTSSKPKNCTDDWGIMTGQKLIRRFEDLKDPALDIIIALFKKMNEGNWTAFFEGNSSTRVQMLKDKYPDKDANGTVNPHAGVNQGKVSDGWLKVPVTLVDEVKTKADSCTVHLPPDVSSTHQPNFYRQFYECKEDGCNESLEVMIKVWKSRKPTNANVKCALRGKDGVIPVRDDDCWCDVGFVQRKTDKLDLLGCFFEEQTPAHQGCAFLSPKLIYLLHNQAATNTPGCTLISKADTKIPKDELKPADLPRDFGLRNSTGNVRATPGALERLRAFFQLCFCTGGKARLEGGAMSGGQFCNQDVQAVQKRHLSYDWPVFGKALEPPHLVLDRLLPRRPSPDLIRRNAKDYGQEQRDRETELEDEPIYDYYFAGETSDARVARLSALLLLPAFLA